MRSNLALRVLTGVWLCVVLCGPSAHALVVPMGLPDLTREAQQVVVAHVDGTSAAWGPARREIVTTVALTVEETLAGPHAPRKLIIQVPGGVIGNLRCEVSDTPKFNVGERCVLFLRPGRPPVVGGYQGKKRLVGDRLVGQALSLGQLRLLVRGGASGTPTVPGKRVGGPGIAGGPAVLQSRGPTPIITNVTPSTVFAGTGFSVTIEGSNFGADRNDSQAQFFYRSGQPKLDADSYSAWSDTQIRCTVPERASSGPVTVSTPGGDSNGYDLSVTFGYGGKKWYAGSIPVDFYVNPNTSDCTGEETAVAAAAASWNSDSGGSPFSFSYQGTTGAGYGRDYQNTCVWTGDLASGTVALNTTWFYPGQIVEFDIQFNDNYVWSTAETTPGGAFDVQSIALHELGHALQLKDLYGAADSAKVMYGMGSAGYEKRALTAADNIGIYWIYPNDAPTVVRVDDVETVRTALGTVLRFSYLDPRPLIGFRIRRRGKGGRFARLSDVPYASDRVDYECLDARRGARPSDYHILGVSANGELQRLFWPAPYGLP